MGYTVGVKKKQTCVIIICSILVWIVISGQEIWAGDLTTENNQTTVNQIITFKQEEAEMQKGQVSRLYYEWNGEPYDMLNWMIWDEAIGKITDSSLEQQYIEIIGIEEGITTLEGYLYDMNGQIKQNIRIIIRVKQDAISDNIDNRTEEDDTLGSNPQDNRQDDSQDNRQDDSQNNQQDDSQNNRQDNSQNNQQDNSQDDQRDNPQDNQQNNQQDNPQDTPNINLGEESNTNNISHQTNITDNTNMADKSNVTNSTGTSSKKNETDKLKESSLKKSALSKATIMKPVIKKIIQKKNIVYVKIKSNTSTKKYTIYRRQKGKKKYKKLGVCTGKIYRDKTVKPGKTYYYKVAIQLKSSDYQGVVSKTKLYSKAKKIKVIIEKPVIKKIMKGNQIQVSTGGVDKKYGIEVFIKKSGSNYEKIASRFYKKKTNKIKFRLDKRQFELNQKYYLRVRLYYKNKSKVYYSDYSKSVAI